MCNVNFINNFNQFKVEALESFCIPYSKKYIIKDFRKNYWTFVPENEMIYFNNRVKNSLRLLDNQHCLCTNGGWESMYHDNEHAVFICQNNLLILFEIKKYIEKCAICKKTGFEIRLDTDMLIYQGKSYCEDCFDVFVDPANKNDLFGFDKIASLVPRLIFTQCRFF